MQGRRVWACIMALATVGWLRAQVITTIAGADWVFPRTSIAAANAPLGRVAGIAGDALGNLYLCDRDNSLVLKVDHNGILSVFAGSGKSGFSGDNGPATSAALNSPAGVAVDFAGNVYIADTLNHRVRKVTDGIITTVVGNGTAAFSGDNKFTAASASLNTPMGIVVDPNGVLYIADAGNARIRRLLASGFLETFAGGGTATTKDGTDRLSATFAFPLSVTIDFGSNVYIVDGARLWKVSQGGTISTGAGGGLGDATGDGGPAPASILTQPCGVTIDQNGSLFISESQGLRIRRITAGVIALVATNGSGPDPGLTQAAYPAGLAVDANNTLYAANATASRVVRVPPSGPITVAFGNGNFRFSGDGLAVSATLYAPQSVITDGAGTIYIADTGNHRVRKISPAGAMTTVAGTGVPAFTGDGVPAASAALNRPTALALDAQGNLFIADALNYRLRRVDGISGRIDTLAGFGDRGQLDGASGLAVDARGNVYVSDTNHHRVLRIDATRSVSSLAGTGVRGYFGDGGAASTAQLSAPSGLIMDTSGSLFIVDTGNHVVRRVSADGRIATVAGNGNLGYTGDGGPSTAATLFDPRGVVVDGSGNLYIADSTTNVVRKVAASDKTITRFAGGGAASALGDGGPATLGFLNAPFGVAVDNAGNVLIADTGNHRLRLVSNGLPYQVSSASLAFSALAGGPRTDAQTLTLTAAGTGLAFTITADAPWLTAIPSAGAMPASVKIVVDPAGLVAGTYTANVTILAPSGAPSSARVPVTVTVQAVAPAPALVVDTTTLTFSTARQGNDRHAQIQVINRGSGTLSFSASVATSSGGGWLSVSPSSGAATLSSPVPLAVNASPGSLAVGRYEGTVTISGAGTSVIVPVTLAVTADTVIGLSQTGLSFVSRGAAPQPQNFAIQNGGSGPMDWQAATTTVSGGNWLKLSPTSGTVKVPNVDSSLVSVSVDPTGLQPGTYSGRVVVDAAGASGSRVLVVFFTVSPPNASPVVDVQPAGLVFTGQVGIDPGPQDVVLTNSSAVRQDFRAASIGRTFTFSPASGSVAPGQSMTLRVSPSFSGLLASAFEFGSISLQFTDGTIHTIGILSIATPPGDCSGATGLSVAFLTTPPAAVLGVPVTLDVQVSDRCGRPIGPGQVAGNAVVSASFPNGDAPVTLTHTGNGVWKGTWRPMHPNTPVTVQIAATVYVPQQSGSASLTADVTANSAIPIVLTDNVPIAPGGVISIYGSNLADALTVGQLPLPLALGGTTVRVGTRAMPLLFAGPGQINLQAPFDLPTGLAMDVTVQRGAVLSAPVRLNVVPALPVLFTRNQQGTGQGIVLHSDQVTLAQAGTPAAAGEEVVIYCTGLGVVAPAVDAGNAASSTVLSRVVNPVTVQIGGVAADVVFAGLAPGFAGLYQVNARVPVGVAGDAVTLTVQVAGQSSPPVTIAVR